MATTIRFEFDSTGFRPPFDSRLTAVRLLYDHLTTYVTTLYSDEIRRCDINDRY